MPRDKTVTNAKIVQAMTEEFLTWGYEKASLTRISAKVGITAAGLYRHFSSKEDMFCFLVKDTLEDLWKLTSRAALRVSADEEYNPFAPDLAAVWTEFIYSHYEGVKLLVCCSAGSRFESFEDELIRMEADGNKAYAEALRKAGRMKNEVSDMQWHILATAYIHLMLEAVRHDMPKEEALKHMRFIGDLLYPGWMQLFGIE